MKKQYPAIVAMRKHLLWIAIIGLGVIMVLIVYNLWHSNNPPALAPAGQHPVVADLANKIDTAWFIEPKTKAMPAQPATTKPLPSPLPISVVAPSEREVDQNALSAPISSNQIRSENHGDEKPTKQSPTPPSNPSSAATEPMNFLQSAKQSSADYLADSIHHSVSRYEIKTGSLIPAILLSGINSDLPGPITAQVRENVYDSAAGRYLLIPQGARLQGIYDSAVVYGQQRVLIAWQRLIFPNGDSLSLQGMPGIDVSGYAGFTDQMNNHYGRLFGSALLMSLISAGLQLSQPQQSNSNNSAPSVNQTLAQNTGIALGQTANQLLQKNLNIPPTLAIRPGYLFNVSVTQDILFPNPYNSVNIR